MADCPVWMHTEGVLMPNQPLVVNQNQGQSVETEEVPIKQGHTGVDELHYSSNFLSPLPSDVHEDIRACDVQDDASISFESEHCPEYIFANPEARFRNGDDDEQLVPQDIDGEIANRHFYPQLSVPLDAQYGTQFQTLDESSLGLPQAVFTAADLCRDLRGMVARGSIEDSQMFATDMSAYIPGSFMGTPLNSQFLSQQSSSSRHHGQALRRQHRDDRRSISSYGFSANINNNPSTDQLLPPMANHGHATVPSIFLSDEPWSSETLRRQGDHQSFLRRETDMLVRQTTRSAAVSTGMYSETDASFMPNNDTEYSVSSLNSTCDDMVESWNTLRPSESLFNGWGWQTVKVNDQPPALLDMTPVSADANPGPYLNMADRHLQDEKVHRQSQVSQLARHVSQSNTHYLSVPGQDDECSEQPSEGSSTSGLVPDTILCEECKASFRGTYRKGNKARHMRLKHNSELPTVYVCDHCPTPKEFNRQDARLKHYRKRHPNLGVEPARPRRLSGISQASSSSRTNSMIH